MPRKPPARPSRAIRRPYPILLALLGALTAVLALAAVEDPRDRPYPHGEWQEDCSFCHRDERWLPVQPTRDFDHAKYFTLEGAHRTAACRACHASLEFPRNRGHKGCVNCHQDVHRGEFGLDCSRCHTPRSFIDRATMTRDHRTYRFPLTGAHVAADCESCHRPQPQGAMSYLSLPTDCADCHFNPGFATAPQRPPATVHPDRTDCETCHDTVAFTFNHAETGFSLTGQHVTLDCRPCHGTPFNPNLNPACESCHLDDYNGTTDPHHPAAGFPTDCTLCHNTASFVGAMFNHSATAFPLTGSHIGLPCSQCHSDGIYDGRPTECYACHRPQYEATVDPYHVVAGFDHDCTLCHNTVSFNGARFTEHDSQSFPIYSGTHSSRWNRCSDCHTSPGSYSEFSCFLCHTQSVTNSQHSGMEAYLYESSACYQCHPRGEVP